MILKRIHTSKAHADDIQNHGAARRLQVPQAPSKARHERLSKIYYLCPDTLLPSAGIRRLYRHTHMLCRAGFNAAILHSQGRFKRDDMPPVPIAHLDSVELESSAVVVIPEGLTPLMQSLKDKPFRRFVIALNWDYIFKNLPDGLDWRAFNIERAMVISPAIGKLITWSMELPVHLIDSGIDHQRYPYHPDIKRPQITFIKRKSINIDQLKRLLGARNNNYIQNIKWVGLEGLSEAEYAEEICKSSIFLNASLAEGYPTSCLEAMAAGTLVVGYDSLGGRDMLCGQGPDQNCILVPNGDYTAMAFALEPLLKDLILGNQGRWQKILSNGFKAVAGITPESEKASVIAFWRGISS